MVIAEAEFIVADFRDQSGKWQIETPKGTLETLALQKPAAQELLQKRLSEVESHAFTPNRRRMTFDPTGERLDQE